MIKKRDRQKAEIHIIRRVIRSKFFTISAIVILIVLVFFLGKVIKKKYEIAQEIAKIQEEKKTLETENERLVEMLDYLKTDSYRDKVAREELGLQKEGESALIFSEGEETVQKEEGMVGKAEKAEEEIYIPNYKKWWNYFFKTES
ncbi:MAG: hypothetical protein ACD_63C00135G0002 [uncultured bacterium]|nr:MAG: hypothetical protein ACD_63C00135G0002 [uncultured bacterium]